MNYRNKFVVEPGGKVHLDKIDPSYTGQARVARKGDAQDTGKRCPHGQVAVPALRGWR